MEKIITPTNSAETPFSKNLERAFNLTFRNTDPTGRSQARELLVAHPSFPDDFRKDLNMRLDHVRKFLPKISADEEDALLGVSSLVFVYLYLLLKLEVPDEYQRTIRSILSDLRSSDKACIRKHMERITQSNLNDGWPLPSPQPHKI